MEDRFERQRALPEVGPHGQELISQARVLVVGVGGLGCPAAQALALAGVGHLTLVDPDIVSVSNLHRQALYTEADAGAPKAEVAARRLRQLAPGISLSPHTEAFTAENGAALMRGHDVVIDGSDRIPVRYAIDDAARKLNVPWIFGAVSRFEGQLARFGPAPWYRDVWPAPPATPPPSCSEEGILGSMPSLIGTWQAHEALQVILGLTRPRNLLLLDTRSMQLDSVPLAVATNGIDIAPEAAATLPLLDVRSDAERSALPIPGAITYSPEEEYTGPVACICESGARSMLAARELRARGVEAYSVRGGRLAWPKA